LGLGRGWKLQKVRGIMGWFFKKVRAMGRKKSVCPAWGLLKPEYHLPVGVSEFSISL